MASCREIINLQFGTYSNYVGTHWWNLQESTFKYSPDHKSEICHDVLFREGLTIRNEVTFAPRLLCVEKDLQLPASISYLEDLPENPPLFWETDKIEKLTANCIDKHPFIEDLDNLQDTSIRDYCFESSIRSWPDFLRTKLLRKSVLTDYNTGKNEEFEDRLRFFTEECDNVEGFHVISDADDDYLSIFDYLHDEFSSKVILSFPLIRSHFVPGFPAAESLVRTLLTWENLSENGTLIVPLSCFETLAVKSRSYKVFPHLEYDPKLDYHSSAIIAAFLETVTVPYRLSSKTCSIADYIAGLNTSQMKFSAGSLSFPFPINPNKTLIKTLEERDDDEALWTCITAGVGLKHVWSQSLCLRGVENPGSALNDYIKYCSNILSNVFAAITPLDIKQPFPRIFSPHVSCRGSVDLSASRANGFHVNSSPTLAGLHSSPNLGQMILDTVETIKNIPLRKMSGLVDIDADVFRNTLDNLHSIGQIHAGLCDID